MKKLKTNSLVAFRNKWRQRCSKKKNNRIRVQTEDVREDLQKKLSTNLVTTAKTYSNPTWTLSSRRESISRILGSG